MSRVAVCVLFAFVLSGCSALGLVSALTSGPALQARAQVGGESREALVAGGDTRQTLTHARARSIEQSAGATGVRAEGVQSVTVRNEAPAWVWLIAILAVGLAGAALADEIRDRARRA